MREYTEYRENTPVEIKKRYDSVTVPPEGAVRPLYSERAMKRKKHGNSARKCRQGKGCRSICASKAGSNQKPGSRYLFSASPTKQVFY